MSVSNSRRSRMLIGGLLVALGLLWLDRHPAVLPRTPTWILWIGANTKIQKVQYYCLFELRGRYRELPIERVAALAFSSNDELRGLAWHAISMKGPSRETIALVRQGMRSADQLASSQAFFATDSWPASVQIPLLMEFSNDKDIPSDTGRRWAVWVGDTVARKARLGIQFQKPGICGNSSPAQFDAFIRTTFKNNERQVAEVSKWWKAKGRNEYSSQ